MANNRYSMVLKLRIEIDPDIERFRNENGIDHDTSYAEMLMEEAFNNWQYEHMVLDVEIVDEFV